MYLGIWCSSKISDKSWIESKLLDLVYEITECGEYGWDKINGFVIECSNPEVVNFLKSTIDTFWFTKPILPTNQENFDKCDLILVLCHKDDSFGSFMADFKGNINLRKYS